MSSDQSYLSSSTYGYDYVVATTQDSINSGLKEYLNNSNQPTTYICYKADDKGNPTDQISLDDLITETGGINPFDIPSGTDPSDPRIQTLTQHRFQVGLKIKLGLPPGVLPSDLPNIVELGSSANNVRFNMLCEELEVIQNTPPGGWSEGSWDVWSQPQGTAWYFSTTVNLLYSALDSELDTPYFDAHPDEKQAILDQLNNLGSSAFSLQQLLFDLDNAALQSIPQIEGMDPGSNAYVVLTQTFVDVYSQAMSDQGAPVLSVTAVDNTPDNSSLRLTGMEREVSPLIDSSGAPIDNPTADQKKAATLDYLCAVNNNHLPGAASFDWNWVEPDQLSEQSGAIAINRDTLANYYKGVLIPKIKPACIKAWTNVSADAVKVSYSWSLTPGQTPQSAEVSASGEDVLVISYENKADDSDTWAYDHGELDIHPSYTCTVSFSGSTITIVQHLKIWVKVVYALTSSSGNVVDKTITDTYTLSVGQNGGLQTASSSKTEDNPQNLDVDSFTDFFTNINDLIDDVQDTANNVVATNFTSIPASDIQNFIFPGARVFTYRDVTFSQNQDLVTAITYVTPS